MSVTNQLNEKLRAIYGRYSTYIDLGGKLLLALISFFWIRSVIGYHSLFSNPFVLLVMALVCAILPLSVIPLFAGVQIIAHAFALGADAGVVAAAVMLLLLILFLRFVPDEAVIMILLPVTMFFGFAPLVPMLSGLKRRTTAVFAVLSGVLTYYFMANLGRQSQKLQTLPLSDYTTRLGLIINGAFSANTVVSILALAAVLITVYLIRRMGFAYCRFVAVVFGGVIYFIFMALGNAVIGTGFVMAAVLIADIGSIAAALILEVLLRPLDYTKSEKLEFEDDDYYYYVKAIPKASVNAKERSRYAASQSLPEDMPEAELEKPDLDHVNFEERLEDSLKNL